MQANAVEVSWDEPKGQWLVRIIIGEEVIRRHIALPRDADPQALAESAREVVCEEGYEDPASGVAIAG